MLELGKRTHVHIGTGHLPLAHFLYLVVHAALVHPFLPFGVSVFGVFRLVEAEFRVAQMLGVLHHFGEDFLAHLLVYLRGFAGDEQLHLDGIQVLPEAFFLAQEREAGDDFGIQLDALFVLRDGDDDAYYGTLVHLQVFMSVGLHQEVELLGIEHPQQTQGDGAYHHGQVVGMYKDRFQQLAGFVGFGVSPVNGDPSLVEQLGQCRFVHPVCFLHFRIPALLVGVEQGSRRHLFGVGLQLHL